MEILRFDGQSGISAQGKKSSKGMLAIGLVATLFGFGSAFASSTITINSNAPIALGQGVTAVTACDENISIAPTTNMRVGGSGPKFYVDTITVSNIDTSTTSTAGVGCLNKYFDLQIFDTSTVAAAHSCSALGSFTTKTVAGSNSPATCGVDNKISFDINGTSTSIAIPFTNFEAAISYITLVSRD